MEEPKAGGVGEHLERALKLSGFVGVGLAERFEPGDATEIRVIIPGPNRKVYSKEG